MLVEGVQQVWGIGFDFALLALISHSTLSSWNLFFSATVPVRMGPWEHDARMSAMRGA